MALSQRMLFVIVLSVSLLLILLIYILPLPALVKAVMAVFALAFDVLAFSVKFYAYIFVPFVRMKNGEVVLSDEEAFTVAPLENAIITRQSGSVYASAFVRIPVYRSASEMGDDERLEMSKLFSRLVSISKEPVRFTSQLYIINKDTYINEISERMNMSEEQYQGMGTQSGVEQQKASSERVRGEVTMWHNLYDNVSRVKSRVLTSFAMVTVQGDNEEEAVNIALQRADEIATGASAIFGVTAFLVEGKELLDLIEVDHMIPTETITEQMKERSMETAM